MTVMCWCVNIQYLHGYGKKNHGISVTTSSLESVLALYAGNVELLGSVSVTVNI